MSAPRRGWGHSGANPTGALRPRPVTDGDRDDDGAHPFAVDGGERYQEIAELGRGGMGTVVAALDLRLGREVALKRIAVAEAERDTARDRFAREAWITASLDHPAIVPIYDAGVGDGGELYYTMRLIRGRTLGAAIAEADGLAGRLALIRHFLGACEAIAHAHSRGVVHRDLKPDNILVAGFGDTQVLDWGVARRLDEAEDRTGPALTSTTLTSAGTIVGTPAYMSPEQAEGAAPDPRADVYGLGAVLFEIVAGRPLRGGDDAATVSGKRTARPRPPLPADAPPELAAIAEHALRTDPAARYADARALAADVASYLDGRRVGAHRYSAVDELRRWARRRRAPIAAGVVGVAVLLGAWSWALVRTRAERDRALGAERRAIVARDVAGESLGRALVEQALTAQANDAQPEAEVLAANALALAESPEARGVLAAFGFAGRPTLRERLDLPLCDRIHPGPDGALLCVRADAVTLLAGRPLAPRWTLPSPWKDATWVDGGARIAVVDIDSHVRLLDAVDGSFVADLGASMQAAAFGPGDGNVAVLVNSEFITVIDGHAAVSHRAKVCPGFLTHLAASAAAGDRIAIACRDGIVVLVDRTGASRRHLRITLQDGADLAAAAVSPDGKRLVVASMIGQLQTYDIATGAVIADRRTRLGVVRTAVFSPDGASVALVGDRGGVSVWTPATWALRRRLPADRDVAAQWSADGSELITIGPHLRRWALQLDRPALRLFDPRPPGLASATISPTGDRLILAAGDGTMHVVDTRDGHRILADRFQPGVLKGAQFLADGGILAWAAGRPSLRRYDAAGTPVATVDMWGLKRAAMLPSGWIVIEPYLLELQLLDPRGGAPRHFVTGSQFLDLDQTADLRRVLALDGTGALWWVDDGDPPRVTYLTRRPGAYAAAVSADGATVAIVDQHAVEILDPITGAVRLRFEAEGQHLFDVALSPQGDRVAVGDGDRRARIWAVADGRLLAVLTGHEARVATVRFTADGGALVTASWDGTARVWGLGDLERPAAALRADIEAAWDLTLATAGRAPLR